MRQQDILTSLLSIVSAVTLAASAACTADTSTPGADVGQADAADAMDAADAPIRRCLDGSTVPQDQPCTRTCADGSAVFEDARCPEGPSCASGEVCRGATRCIAETCVEVVHVAVHYEVF